MPTSLAVTTVVLLGIVAHGVQAEKRQADVSATCQVDENTIVARSTKDISNIVYFCEEGGWEKLDGLSGRTYTFTDTECTITKVCVKSGNNFDPDCDVPGCGECVMPDCCEVCTADSCPSKDPNNLSCGFLGCDNPTPPSCSNLKCNFAVPDVCPSCSGVLDSKDCATRCEPPTECGVPARCNIPIQTPDPCPDCDGILDSKDCRTRCEQPDKCGVPAQCNIPAQTPDPCPSCVGVLDQRNCPTRCSAPEKCGMMAVCNIATEDPQPCPDSCTADPATGCPRTCTDPTTCDENPVCEPDIPTCSGSTPFLGSSCTCVECRDKDDCPLDSCTNGMQTTFSCESGSCQASTPVACTCGCADDGLSCKQDSECCPAGQELSGGICCPIGLVNDGSGNCKRACMSDTDCVDPTIGLCGANCESGFCATAEFCTGATTCCKTTPGAQGQITKAICQNGCGDNSCCFETEIDGCRNGLPEVDEHEESCNTIGFSTPCTTASSCTTGTCQLFWDDASKSSSFCV